MYIIVANVARKDNEALIQTTVVSRSSIWSNALFGPPPPSKSGLVFRWMRAQWPIASGPEYGPSIHCFYSKWIVIFPIKAASMTPPPQSWAHLFSFILPLLCVYFDPYRTQKTRVPVEDSKGGAHPDSWRQELRRRRRRKAGSWPEQRHLMSFI
jgi:hypothetical protein